MKIAAIVLVSTAMMVVAVLDWFHRLPHGSEILFALMILDGALVFTLPSGKTPKV